MKRDISLVRLSRDHQRGLALSKHVENVFAGIEETPLARLRDEVIDFWRTGLLPHFRAECECVLARLARHVRADDELLTRTERDHVALHALITDLRETEDEPEQRVLIGEIAALLKEHIRWEESVLFEATQTLLSADALTRLGADISEYVPEVPPAPAWFARD